MFVLTSYHLMKLNLHFCFCYANFLLLFNFVRLLLHRIYASVCIEYFIFDTWQWSIGFVQWSTSTQTASSFLVVTHCCYWKLFLRESLQKLHLLQVCTWHFSQMFNLLFRYWYIDMLSKYLNHIIYRLNFIWCFRFSLLKYV